MSNVTGGADALIARMKHVPAGSRDRSFGHRVQSWLTVKRGVWKIKRDRAGHSLGQGRKCPKCVPPAPCPRDCACDAPGIVAADSSETLQKWLQEIGQSDKW